jgi:hypothetical protein
MNDIRDGPAMYINRRMRRVRSLDKEGINKKRDASQRDLKQTKINRKAKRDGIHRDPNRERAKVETGCLCVRDARLYDVGLTH